MIEEQTDEERDHQEKRESLIGITVVILFLVGIPFVLWLFDLRFNRA